jgi:hypothetical protein
MVLLWKLDQCEVECPVRPARLPRFSGRAGSAASRSCERARDRRVVKGVNALVGRGSGKGDFDEPGINAIIGVCAPPPDDQTRIVCQMDATGGTLFM